MANALKWITTRAKQIYKKGGTWKSAIKKAGAEYRSKKKKPAAKKKAVPRRKKKSGSKIRRKKVGAIRSNVDRVDRKRVNVTIGSVASHKSAIKRGLKIRLEKKAGARELATRKPARRKLSQEIAKIKKDIRALC